MTARDLWERVRKYFNLMPDKEDESAIVEQISSGVSFRGANLWVLIFAIRSLPASMSLENIRLSFSGM